jgi:RNA polymerase sigma-70 factor (ECF subfamily)
LSSKDLQLLKKALDGDMAAFEELVSSNYSHIYNLCYRMMRNQQDAEDMLQESMLKAWRKLKSFKQSSSFSTWLHRIAVNTCLDALRKNKKNNSVSVDEMDEFGKHIVDDETSNFEDVTIQKDVVHNALSQLKDRERIIIVLKDVQGYSYEEIAKIFRCPMGTVRSRISRARASMINILNSMEQNCYSMRQNKRKRI